MLSQQELQLLKGALIGERSQSVSTLNVLSLCCTLSFDLSSSLVSWYQINTGCVQQRLHDTVLVQNSKGKTKKEEHGSSCHTLSLRPH